MTKHFVKVLTSTDEKTESLFAAKDLETGTLFFVKFYFKKLTRKIDFKGCENMKTLENKLEENAPGSIRKRRILDPLERVDDRKEAWITLFNG